MTSKTLLIAEDDPSILQGLCDLLDSEGYQVVSATDGQQALDLFRKHQPDLLILDVRMPVLSGFDVCLEIRKQDSHTPILFLTAQNEESDQVFGLRSGGDDYITKPFGMQALLARIEALLRRAKPSPQPPSNPLPDTFTFGQANVNRKRYEIEFQGNTLPLSARELALLELFHQHPGEVLSRETLLQEVWGIHYFGTTRTLDQHIAQLRKKVESDPRHPVHLTTVHGVGYCYEPGPDV